MDIIDKCPSNHTVISLDDPVPNSFASYRNGIGYLRWYCRSFGRFVDVSRIFGHNLGVFTTPPGGPFHVTLVYEGRSLKLTLHARDLYIMGWRGPYGTVEIKAPSEKRKNYMLGENVTILPTYKNYYYLASSGLLQNVLLGPHALRPCFNVLYKYDGKCTAAVLEAVATAAVNLAEPARIQDIYDDVCTCYQDDIIFPLDSRRDTNSVWVRKYSHYGGVVMRRIDAMLSGNTPEPILSNKGIHIQSDIQILNTIRILPRDGHDQGKFVREARPSEPTEGDSDVEDRGCNLKDVKGRKSAHKRPRYLEGKNGDLKLTRSAGDGRSPTTFPSYLVEEWYPLVNLGEQSNESESGVDGTERKLQTPGNGEESSEQNGEEVAKESELSEKDKKSDNEPIESGKEHVRSMYKTTEITPETSFTDFLDHFPAVRKIYENRKSQLHLEVITRPIERFTCPALVAPVSSALQAHSSLKQGALSSSRAMTCLGENKAYGMLYSCAEFNQI